jgi:hypothetical protein
MPRKTDTIETPRDQREDMGADDVAVRTNATAGDVIEYGGPAMQALVSWLAAKAEGTDDDTYADAEAMIRRVLSSDNPDEVLREETILHGKEFLDQPFLCHGFRVREGEFEDGAPFYALLDVTIAAGTERRVVSCGGWRVLAALSVLDNLGEWPQEMMIKGNRTKKGFTALNLVTHPSSSGCATGPPHIRSDTNMG